MIDLLLNARKMPQKGYKKYQVQQSDIKYMPKEQAHGIIFGIQPNNQLFVSPEDEPYHTMVIGGTRSGKTSAIDSYAALMAAYRVCCRHIGRYIEQGSTS